MLALNELLPALVVMRPDCQRIRLTRALSNGIDWNVITCCVSLDGHLTVCKAARNRLNLGIPTHTHAGSASMSTPVPKIACPKACESGLGYFLVQKRKQPYTHTTCPFC